MQEQIGVQKMPEPVERVQKVPPPAPRRPRFEPPKKMVREEVFDSTRWEHSDDWPPEQAEGFLAWFKEKLEQVPEEFRETATIKIDSEADDGDSFPSIFIAYMRPETEEEEQEREQAAKDRRETERRQELQLLEHLRKKYEGEDV